MSEVRVEQLPAIHLAVVKRLASPQQLSSVVPAACGTVWNALKALQTPGAGRHVAIYWDGHINLEVGVELPHEFPGHGEVVGSATPAGLIASATHFGPYGQLGTAHQAIVQHCRSQGLKLAGPNWEIYGHWLNEWNQNPQLIRTDVFYLLS